MKPVLLQHLMKHNRGKSKATPISQEEIEKHNSGFASFVLWFVCALVLLGLFRRTGLNRVMLLFKRVPFFIGSIKGYLIRTR